MPCGPTGLSQCLNLIFFISKLSNASLQIESLAVVHRINDFNITPPLKDTL